MRILHTSDWHLGLNFFSHRRDEELSAYLQWLVNMVKEAKVDALLVAGDIFDSTTPGNIAQKQYGDFLACMLETQCRDIIITAGNHDSAALLNTNKSIFKKLNIHVVGNISFDHPEEEIIVLYDHEKRSNDQERRPLAIVCAVPFIRESDVPPISTEGDCGGRDERLKEGIRLHYKMIGELAENMRNDFREKGRITSDIPIIAMGHLAMVEGKVTKDDKVRKIFIGNLEGLAVSIFPSCINYVALGHYHVPQKVKNFENIRYCGSPIPIGFGEADQEKQVLIIDFDGTRPTVTPRKIDRFRDMAVLSGNLEQILEKILELKKNNSNAWISVICTENEYIAEFQEKVEEAVKDTDIVLGSVQYRRLENISLDESNHDEGIDEINEIDMFQRLLDKSDLYTPECKSMMKLLYEEVLLEVQQEDNDPGKQ